MKKLAVVITTHISEPSSTIHRHSNFCNLSGEDDILFRYFRDICIKNYQTLDSGLAPEDWEIIIVNTGTPHPECRKWLGELAKEKQVRLINVPNNGGAWAGLKTFMHTMPWLAYEYEHFLFHVDDGVEPIADGWATDMLDAYHKKEKTGIMGRKLETIVLGPNGLPDHRNICGHIAEMWGIQEDPEEIPHLHGDYWMMDTDTLLKLATVWFNPGLSPSAMKYQVTHEQMNFKDLFNMAMQNGTQKEFEDMHIGREVDTPLRIELVDKRVFEYPGEGTYFKAQQLHHRKPELIEQLSKTQ